MYIFKNAYLNVIRCKGRNILIGIIITAITIAACIALAINKSGSALVQSYKDSNPLAVSFKLDQMTLRNASDDEKTSFTSLTVENIISYGDSTYVKDYYYKSETTLNSDQIEAVSYDDVLETTDESSTDTTDTTSSRPEGAGGGMSIGDYRITGYSDASYIDNFIDGTNKIIEGEMFTKDNTDKVIVISEDLAEANDLEVGDTVTFYSSDDTTTTYELTIIGIYEDNSDSTSSSFMGMSAMNSANQIYTNIATVTAILENSTTDDTKSISNNGLTAYYYLNDNNDLEAFEAEVREKGLSDYYTVSTNEEEALSALAPISNLSNFSFTFLILILIVGSIILSIINMINIRERKYEIGVLRAIGMSKFKVALQLVSEIFIVAIASLIIGTGIGAALSQPATNIVLANEISNYESESSNIQENFGGSGFERPGFSESSSSTSSSSTNKPSNMNTTNYVDSLDVSMDVITILELFAVSLVLTTVSGLVSVMFVNKYEPNKILQNRS